MKLADAAIVIDRPPLEVHAYVLDHENYPEWFPDAQNVSSVDDTPHGTVGKRYREKVRVSRRRTTVLTIEVVECEPGRLFATQSRIGPFATRMEIHLEELPAATRLRWIFLANGRSRLNRLVFRLLAGRGIARRGAKAVANLKRILETSDAVLPV
jgi:hypothetical protein